LQRLSEVERLAQKYPSLPKKLIQRLVERQGPKAGRTQAQKEELLKMIGIFEGPGNLSETIDEQLHQPTDRGDG
jgi:hypothetical protein